MTHTLEKERSRKKTNASYLLPYKSTWFDADEIYQERIPNSNTLTEYEHQSSSSCFFLLKTTEKLDKNISDSSFF